MGSANKSSAKQSSSSFNDPAQAPYLAQLRSGAMNAFQGMPSQAPLYAQAAAGAGQLAGTQFADPAAMNANVRSGLTGFDPANPYAAKLADYAARMQQGSSQGIDQVVGTLGEDINRTLREMLGGAGGVNTASALSGTLGGGRNEVSTGIAQRGALDAFGREAGNIRLSDYQARQGQALQALQGAGSLQGQSMGLDLSRLGQISNLNQGEQQAGLSNALGMGALQTQAQELGFAPFRNNMTLWQQLASVIGGPNVLNQSRGKSDSSGISILQPS